MRILCFGDSNTWGLNGATGQRHSEEVRWTQQVARLTGHTVIEEGMNSRTTAFDDPFTPGGNGLTYLTPCLISQSPLDLVIFCLGTNDLKTHIAGRASISASGLGLLLQTTRQLLGDVKILVVSPVCIGEVRKTLGPLIQLGEDCYEQSHQFARFMKPVAEQWGAAFLDAQDYTEPGMADGVHLDEQGHLALGRAVADKVLKILG